MIKIKILELNRHRNETTFRPFFYLKNLFSEIGVQFVTEGKSDITFVGQASISDKSLSLEDSVDKGLSFLKNVDNPYYIFDGQDATSLIGTYDVFKESNARNLFKYILLKDKSLYNQSWLNGRIFWGKGNYRCKDFNSYSDKILLSGFNWLNTYGYDINVVPFNIKREIDVCALFGTVSENYEHKLRTDVFYNSPREKMLDIISNMNFNCKTSRKHGKLPKNQYYNTLTQSKIYVSPYGFGEYAIRDLEAMQFGCILIKPDMSHMDGIPNIFYKDKTYISCKPDLSDLEEKIEYAVSNYETIYPTFYKNVKDMIVKEFDPYIPIKYYHDFLKKLPEITVS
jgi:hypothetical protein